MSNPLDRDNVLQLFAKSMKGPGWNGRDFFPDEHVTILSRNENEIDLANSLLLIPTDKPEQNAVNLRKIIALLIPDNLANKVEFLAYYAELYSGFRVLQKGGTKDERAKATLEGLLSDSKESQKTLERARKEFKESIAKARAELPAKHTEKEDEIKISLKEDLRMLEEVFDQEAYRILSQCRFGDNSVFQGFQANDGESDKPLAWPADAIKWSSQARLEFLLYTAGLEYNLPKALRETLAFNYANKLECDFSRKPSTCGCEEACKVRLSKDGKRGISEELEMKSMIFLARDSNRKDKKGNGRLIFVAVHIEGDSEVNKGVIIRKFEEFGIALEKVDKKKNHSNPLDNLLDRNGAQQKIGVFAAGINPISVIMGVKRKYGRSQVSEFDTIFFIQDDLFKLQECYNNAGSPTWGMRFDPRTLLSAVEREAANINKAHGADDLIKIVHGDFQRPKLSIATPVSAIVGVVQDQAIAPPEARKEIA